MYGKFICCKPHKSSFIYTFAPKLPFFWMKTIYFWVVLRRGSLMCLVTPGSANGSTSVCPWLWSGEMLPAYYWPVCEFDLTLRVLFLVATFNILITITAYHLPLYQCAAIAFRILVLSVRFIFSQLTVVQCYLVHWLNTLLIAWPMMRVQRGFVFNIAWNLWGRSDVESNT